MVVRCILMLLMSFGFLLFFVFVFLFDSHHTLLFHLFFTYTPYPLFHIRKEKKIIYKLCIFGKHLDINVCSVIKMCSYFLMDSVEFCALCFARNFFSFP